MRTQALVGIEGGDLDFDVIMAVKSVVPPSNAKTFHHNGNTNTTRIKC